MIGWLVQHTYDILYTMAALAAALFGLSIVFFVRDEWRIK